MFNKNFRPYLFGRKFSIKTDHRPLVWLNSFKEPHSKLARRRIKLNEFDYHIEYLKGKENPVADFLSSVEINANENIESSETDGTTIHSGVGKIRDHIYISEKPLNSFKTQIIIDLSENQKN